MLVCACVLLCIQSEGEWETGDFVIQGEKYRFGMGGLRKKERDQERRREGGRRREGNGEEWNQLTEGT